MRDCGLFLTLTPSSLLLSKHLKQSVCSRQQMVNQLTSVTSNGECKFPHMKRGSLHQTVSVCHTPTDVAGDDAVCLLNMRPCLLPYVSFKCRKKKNPAMTSAVKPAPPGCPSKVKCLACCWCPRISSFLLCGICFVFCFFLLHS